MNTLPIGQPIREILDSMFDILEAQKIVEGEARITMVPPKSDLLTQLLVAQGGAKSEPAKKG